MTIDELIDLIKINIEDKCNSLTAKGKCMIGCWNCQVSEALLQLLYYAKPSDFDFEDQKYANLAVFETIKRALQ